MKGVIPHFLKEFISWWFRKRSPLVITSKVSGAILITVLGLSNFTGTLSYNGLTFDLTQNDSIISIIVNGTVIGSLAVFVSSFVLLAVQHIRDRSFSSKRKVVVLEARGLRDDDGTSLADSLGDELPKNRVPYILDLRQRLDGKLVDPADLIPRVAAAKESLNQIRRGNSRDDTLIVYGGLTAVPFTFLTGVELDDEGAILVFDWDRTIEQWRPLDDLDDGHRLSEPNLDELPKSNEVLLAISISYPINSDDLDTSFDLPVVRLNLSAGSSSSHWSAGKQSAIATQFLEICKRLSERNIKHIHLILAAPNSVVFNFGRRYDKRNLPELTVYQYERGHEIKYPWGVRMPVCSTVTPQVEKRVQSAAK